MERLRRIGLRPQSQDAVHAGLRVMLYRMWNGRQSFPTGYNSSIKGCGVSLQGLLKEEEYQVTLLKGELEPSMALSQRGMQEKNSGLEPSQLCGSTRFSKIN